MSAERASVPLWIGWAVALAIATGAVWFDTWFWIGIRAPDAFGGRDAGGGAILGVGMLLAGLVVALVAWIAAALEGAVVPLAVVASRECSLAATRRASLSR